MVPVRVLGLSADYINRDRNTVAAVETWVLEAGVRVGLVGHGVWQGHHLNGLTHSTLGREGGVDADEGVCHADMRDRLVRKRYHSCTRFSLATGSWT